MPGWKIRSRIEPEYDLGEIYDGQPTMCKLDIHHGGTVVEENFISNYSGKTTYVDYVDLKNFSLVEMNDIMRKMGYSDDLIKSFEFIKPYCSFTLGGLPIYSDDDLESMIQYISGECKCINVIVEHHMDKLAAVSPRMASLMPCTSPSKQTESASPRLTKKTARKSVRQLTNKDLPRRLVLESETERENQDTEGEENEGEETEGEENEVEENEGENEGQNEECDDEVLVEDDNVLTDVNVDKSTYMLNLSQQDIGGNVLNNQIQPPDGDEELEVINPEYFDSGSDIDANDIDRNNDRLLRKLRKEQQSVPSDNAPFYVGQVFGESSELKELIKVYSVESRRSIKLLFIDKRRVRAVCDGVVPAAVGPDNGPSKNPVGPSDKGKQPANPNSSTCNDSNNICPWVLHCSKLPCQETWMVKTFKGLHTCLQSREIRHCTSKYMASKIREQINRNPGIPTRALQEELEQKMQISVSRMKAFRAKQQATIDCKGDFHSQYALLRDYCEELKLQNPGTTVKIEVERTYNPNDTTRQFKRIYICLGSLKAGFKACGRELIGLDGAFMKGPYPGQILTAVGVDSNNGIYPVAYAVVEAENRESWTWFLQYLGDDLDLQPNYNFTFISDRQKGLIQAINNVFPTAEHRYCLKHIHENMKLHWRGRAYKDHLWRCATATTKPQFATAMENFKAMNVDAYNWLAKIDPQYWARSHFSGRCKSDMLLNNLCECLNKELVPAREKPIIACVDFIREYLMKRIVVVQKVIDKSKGPLTPSAMAIINVTKQEANECKVEWNGGVKYQVSAPWGDQCVVDVEHMVCSCRKWELTGLPCKHAIATNWCIFKQTKKGGIPEQWAHKSYWLDTWKEAYTHKVNPVTGTSTWTKTNCTFKLIPPVHHNPVGRPKKKRRRGLYKDEPLVKDGKLSRKINFGNCKTCGNRGHNSRTCKGQGGETSQGGGSQQGVANQSGVNRQSQVGGSQRKSQPRKSQNGKRKQTQSGSQQGVPSENNVVNRESQNAGSQVGGTSQVGGSQVGGTSEVPRSSQGARSSQAVGSSQVAGSSQAGKKVVKKVRGKSQRILRQRLAEVIPGPGLTENDAMVVD